MHACIAIFDLTFGREASASHFYNTSSSGALFFGVFISATGGLELGAFHVFLDIRSWAGAFSSVGIGALRNELASPQGSAEREQIKQAAEFRGCPRGGNIM
jgi:hypothetical protein